MLDKRWFSDASRTRLIAFCQDNLDRILGELAVTPTSENIGYNSGVVRANIAWFRTLLHIANPDLYPDKHLSNKVRHPLNAMEYEKWRLEFVNRLVVMSPSSDPVTATYIHQLINNGVNYEINT